VITSIGTNPHSMSEKANPDARQTTAKRMGVSTSPGSADPVSNPSKQILRVVKAFGGIGHT
jgi:hypothetical protein